CRSPRSTCGCPTFIAGAAAISSASRASLAPPFSPTSPPPCRCVTARLQLDSLSTLQGLTSIRAFGAQQRFIEENEALIDLNNKARHSPSSRLLTRAQCFLHFWLVARWLALRLDWISAIIAGVTAFYSVIGNVSPSIAGLTVSQALQIAGILQWTVR